MGSMTRSPNMTRLVEAYPSLGYEIVTLPQAAVAARADFVMRALQA